MFTKTGNEAHEAFVGVAAVFLGENGEPQPFSMGETVANVVAKRVGLTGGVPGFHQIICILLHEGAIARTHKTRWAGGRGIARQIRLAT